jgi:hypothetical protein
VQPRVLTTTPSPACSPETLVQTGRGPVCGLTAKPITWPFPMRRREEASCAGSRRSCSSRRRRIEPPIASRTCRRSRAGPTSSCESSIAPVIAASHLDPGITQRPGGSDHPDGQRPPLPRDRGHRPGRRPSADWALTGVLVDAVYVSTPPANAGLIGARRRISNLYVRHRRGVNLLLPGAPRNVR